jgi:transposase-like protein
MDWKNVYEDFYDLPKSEQLRLFQAIKDTLFPEPKEDIAKIVGEIREVRFSGGLACVHCGSVNIKRNGKYRSRQRYLCKECGKSFNDMTASPISGTHYPHKLKLSLVLNYRLTMCLLQMLGEHTKPMQKKKD